MDWLEVLKIHKGLEFFFDVSVPAAIEKGKCFGHVLLICPDAAVRKHFVNELTKQLEPLAQKKDMQEANLLSPVETSEPSMCVRSVSWDRTIKPSEIAATLTNMGQGEVLLLDREEIDFFEESMQMLYTAMGAFALDIIVGSGINAKSIRLDLPEFTFMVCTAQETEAVEKLKSHFAYVIKISKSDLREISEKTVIMKAQEEGYSLTDEACAYLAMCADCDCMAAENYIDRVVEYMRHYYAVGAQITEEHAEDIMRKLGVSPKEEKSNNDSTDELRIILRDIRKRLDDIYKAVAEVKNGMAEIKGDEDFSSLSEIGRSLEAIEETLC